MKRLIEKPCAIEKIDALHSVTDDSETCLRCGKIQYIPEKKGVTAFAMRTVLAKQYGLRVDVTGIQGRWILHFDTPIHAKRFTNWVRDHGIVMSDDAMDYMMSQFRAEGKEI